MRSAETSGGGGNGFGMSGSELPAPKPAGGLLASFVRLVAGRISPTTAAVAMTALVCATLSVAFDIVRSLDEERALQQQMMHVAAASRSRSGATTARR